MSAVLYLIDSDSLPITRPAGRPDIEVHVLGKPATKGSSRSHTLTRKDGSLVTRPDGKPMVVTRNDNADAKQYEQALAQAALAQMQEDGTVGTLFDGPLAVELVFARPRPKGHYGTGRNADVLKDSAPLYPSTKPDVDKTARVALDALTGVVWRDDAQVASLSVSKVYSVPQRTVVRVWRLTSPLGQSVLGPEWDPPHRKGA